MKSLRLGLPMVNQESKPFVGKRGIKINIPWDARTPSYGDTGDSAQNNIATTWDFEFWKAYLDELAGDRYNVLNLWSTLPYSNRVKLEDFPEAALPDVHRLKDGLLKPEFKNKLQDLDQNGDGDLDLEHDSAVLELVKKMTIDEKIAHWQRVFQYAEDRGIEIYLFHWTVFAFGAIDKHGIRKVKLYVNGLLANAEEDSKEGPCVWSGSRDDLLQSMRSGPCHLAAVAIDKNGTRTRRGIQIKVGKVANNAREDRWMDEIHQVILKDGGRIMTREEIEFPRLECKLRMNQSGKLVLHPPGNRYGLQHVVQRRRRAPLRRIGKRPAALLPGIAGESGIGALRISQTEAQRGWPLSTRDHRIQETHHFSRRRGRSNGNRLEKPGSGLMPIRQARTH